jgi:hypothetical protein
MNVDNLPTTVSELGNLAEKGALAVVGSMATGAFRVAQARIAKLFGKLGPGEEQATHAQLDADEGLVQSAAEVERADVRGELAPLWRRRLARLLAEHPDVELELTGLLTELESALPAEQQQWVQTVIARDHGRAYAAQGGNVIHHEHHGPATEQSPPAAGAAAGRRR